MRRSLNQDLKEISDLGFRHGVLVPTIQYNMVEEKNCGFGYDAGMRYGKSHQEFADKLGIKDSIQILHDISIPLYISMAL